MSCPDAPRVAYVVKRYPRYSETFIVNEILAHEQAGLPLEIVTLHPSSDTHFQDCVSKVRAPVNYLPAASPKSTEFWQRLQEAAAVFPGFWEKLDAARGEDGRVVHQAIALAHMVKDKGIGHLHAHFGTSATAVARLAATFAGVPYSFTAHAKDIFHDSVDPADMQRKLQDASSVVTVSDYNLSYLQQTYGTAAAGVRRIYNGMERERLGFHSPRQRLPLIVAVWDG